MKDKLIRQMTGTLRSTTPPRQPVADEPPWHHWTGQPVLDRDGVGIGHVIRVTEDGDGARLKIAADWNPFYSLLTMGLGNPQMLTVRSEDVEEDAEGRLTLKLTKPREPA